MPLTGVIDETKKDEEVGFQSRAGEVTLLTERVLPELLEFVLSCL